MNLVNDMRWYVERVVVAAARPAQWWGEMMLGPNEELQETLGIFMDLWGKLGVEGLIFDEGSRLGRRQCEDNGTFC
jgi:hypothetical protein